MWGTTTDGRASTLYTLSSDAISVTVCDYGARIVGISTPDRSGVWKDVVLGYNSLAKYEGDRKQYFGATIGRFANRIAHGRFAVGGNTFQVPVNNGPNALHGGREGFDRRLWNANVLDGAVEMVLLSPDGDMGFPGDLHLVVRFSLDRSDLRIDYAASTSKPTIVNVTNHAYFNLSGESSGDILAHHLRIHANAFTPVDAGLIPTGELQPVDQTPFDLRASQTIARGLSAKHPQLRIAGGFDHNFALANAQSDGLHLAAEVFDPRSGRSLRVRTTEPGVQFYSGNFLDGSVRGKEGSPYNRNAGFCLETQHFPDSPNHAHFPSTELVPGQQFRSTTVMSFGVEP